MKNMYRFAIILLGCMLCLSAKAQDKIVVITTNVGTMKARLYPDVPNHTKTFINRATKGEFNGTLFTRVIKNFMIQGGAPDSRNAPEGARVGSGDRSAEIMPEFREQYFHKKGTLAAPRQGDDINPQKKSDMSQFYIVQGKVYRPGELDTLQLAANLPIKRKAMAQYYTPVKELMDSLKTAAPAEYNKYVVDINAKVDSVIRNTPGHLLFTDEQREAYTTIGGTHHLDAQYTIFGELTEGFDILDKIASQPKDTYDRPKKDIRIISVTVE
ncbi:peptidyl-prolyl cis-trans isomerase B (cyclophilin B) [Parabacteroides sp. PF5-5]|uniref:peptidylprolyl isomerase n=1 Tax=unclassified Parabacteroides TaxID=2649774 RepID=UPI002476CBBA|nr:MULTISPECIES: peptidylprolyl isomerase [unclassified Parabacteroides]MDH6303903.1 peptidyl-prolyl cis-trans isomerase B (cyclophilin B) [Parabacteroides sp. PH5-39]MDH6314520.1 peptidyl-prolyl cis-trans isomerase B (cyclophilin B) [Parabacteroides sp. PF5-13]MDH6318415.1 peptidyl-prolyl cis-trans isomerase B (cyclophilin B) [Parabacteroides sp. PH5-13]MDH6322292.1 peptidyl-prolyl cis-trans isomerase B (cyclophilin B) [Parabacteroides sp. PH5-8]MDH6325628.1 peptidyl-prolyl cis-trans isomeras